MYTPSTFSVEDKETIYQFIENHSFGIIISHGGEEFHDTHTPLYATPELNVLYGHIAKANSQWKDWQANAGVKVLFHGPHTYISPNYYVGSFNVPTWNYTAVSISGVVEILDSLEEKKKVIQSLVAKNEENFPKPWKLDESDERVMNLFNAIVCFRVNVQKIEAKFKLNQNKDIEERQSVIKHLKTSNQFMDLEIAKLMEQSLG